MVGEGLQEVACVQGLRLVDSQILLFHLALTLVGLSFEVSVDLLDDGGIAVVVDHTERLDLAELPVGRLVRRLVRPLRVSLGVGADAFVEGEEDAEVSHPKRHIVDASDSLRELGAYLQEVSLRGAEDGDGAIDLLGVLMEVGVVVRAVVVEAEELSEAADGDGLGSLSEDGEGVLRHIVLDRWAQLCLQAPYAGVVVGRVELDITDVSLVEVELATCGVVEAVLDGELNEVVRSQIVCVVLGVVLAEAALVPRDEVLIFGDAGSEPAVSRGGLKVPDLVAVDEADAEAFGHPVHLDERAEAFDTFASGVDVGQDDVEDGVLSDAVGYEGVGFEGAIATEDTFGSTHTDADAVEASASPVAVEVVGGKGGVAKSALGEVAAEGAVESNEALGTMVGVFVDLKVLRQDGVPVLTTCDDHRAVGGVLASDDDGGTFGGVVRV